MPAVRLPAFIVFEATDFHIGGDLGAIESTEAQWSQAAQGLRDEQGSLEGVDFSGYIGSEGEASTELACSVYASRVGSAAEAIQKVTGAIDGYSQDYAEIKTEMDQLKEVARGDHLAVDLAANAVDQAELELTAAMATGNPGAITAAELHLVKCQAAHTKAMTTWETDIADAADIKFRLGGLVDARVAEANAVHTSYNTGAVEFSGGPSQSDGWEVHASVLTQAANKIKEIAQNVRSFGESLPTLSGADEVHGMRMAAAVDAQCNTWQQQCSALADRLEGFAGAIEEILRLIEQWDQNLAKAITAAKDSMNKFIVEEIAKGDPNGFRKHFTPTTFDYVQVGIDGMLTAPITMAENAAKEIPKASYASKSVATAAKQVNWLRAPTVLGRSTPVLGAALGSASDIKQGVDPKLAIGSNVAGAAAGAGASVLAAGYMGATFGSVVPGIGTVAGFAAGVAVSYLTTKGIQWAAK